jgi:hypothetical protein
VTALEDWLEKEINMEPGSSCSILEPSKEENKLEDLQKLAATNNNAGKTF